MIILSNRCRLKAFGKLTVQPDYIHLVFRWNVPGQDTSNALPRTFENQETYQYVNCCYDMTEIMLKVT